jgi:dUTP pyrophosphatase
MSADVVKVKLLVSDAVLPSYKTLGSSGADLVSTVNVRIDPGMRFAVPTGIAIELPDGYEAQVRPRSGLSIDTGVTVLNAPGTIDNDYRGELKVILVNLGQHTAYIDKGDRIAQLVIAPVTRANFQIVDALEGSARGAGGFGSTGK